MKQTLTLWGDAADASPRYPLVGTQKDIQYFGSSVQGVLNSPTTTGMPFWSINPYVGCAFGCAYCYARYAHRFAMERAVAAESADQPLTTDHELPPWMAFERRIFVKKNAADVLRRSLAQRESAAAVTKGDTIVIGTATDPYQPAERLFRVTRSVLEVLAEARGLRVVIITKSPLLTRDIDLLTRIARRSRLTIHLSLITLDRDLARRLEPRAPTPEARLRALTRLREAGIDTGINIMPVLPGLTDRPDGLAALVRRVAAGGALHINCCALRLRATARRRYLPFLAQEFPHLADRYRTAYASDHQIAPKYREGLRQFMQHVCRDAGIRYGTPDELAMTTRAGQSWEAEAPVADALAVAEPLPDEHDAFWKRIGRAEQLELMQ